MQTIAKRAWLGMTALLFILWTLLFVSAGTLDFWQAWLYGIVFCGSAALLTSYFLKHDPALVRRRSRSGPIAEREPVQKIIQSLTSILFILQAVIPGLDRRFQWSQVPAALVLASDALVAGGYLIVFRVFQENSFASSTIEVHEGQRVVSTGPYAIVRHPMYAGALVMLVLAPLALGSYWALLLSPLLAWTLACRILDEERFLIEHLPGYEAYRAKTRYRLIPRLW